MKFERISKNLIFRLFTSVIAALVTVTVLSYSFFSYANDNRIAYDNSDDGSEVDIADTPLLKATNAGVVAGGIITNNIHGNEYTSTRKVADSAIVNNNNGTFGRVENMGDIVLVESYSADFKLIGQMFINMELPIYGGCFSGAAYNYVLFGQTNYEKNSAKEVVRVVKYTKDWIRVGAVSICGCNTAEPFFGSNSDLSEWGNKVFVRMGHKTYSGCQACMTFSFDSSTMTFKDVSCNDKVTETSCYANSAAVFIDASDGRITVADHSMTDPYAAVVSRYSNVASQDKFNSYTYKAMALEPGKGTVSLGGLESSSQYYLLVGAASPQDGSSPNKNVFISAVPKGTIVSGTDTAYLTGYAYGDGYTVTTPYIVKVTDDSFVVIWEARKGYSDTQEVNYAYVDGAGNLRGEVKKISGCLSDCQPMNIAGNICWYTTDGATMKIYSIPAYSDGARTADVAAAQVFNGVDYSMVYDYSFYIATYPDMRVLYQHDPEGAIRHFVTVGMYEGRQGCDNFNINVYRSNYKELNSMYGNNLPMYYYHFMTCGYAEGRNARRYF